MAVKTYRRRPVEIRALAYTGNDDELKEFVGEQLAWARGGPYLQSPGGDVLIKRRDYVIETDPGHFSVCDPEVFDVLYQELT